MLATAPVKMGNYLKTANKHTNNNPNNKILSQDAFHKLKLCLGHNRIHIAL